MCELTETYTAQLKLTHIGTRPTAHTATIHFARGVFRLPLRPDNHRFLGHKITPINAYTLRSIGARLPQFVRKGIPKARSSAIASSSLSAVVTIVMSIPRIASMSS